MPFNRLDYVTPVRAEHRSSERSSRASGKKAVVASRTEPPLRQLHSGRMQCSAAAVFIGIIHSSFIDDLRPLNCIVDIRAFLLSIVIVPLSRPPLCINVSMNVVCLNTFHNYIRCIAHTRPTDRTEVSFFFFCCFSSFAAIDY